MHDVGAPLIYRDMVIPVYKLNSEFRQLMATTKDHRGLPHVRALRVTSTGLNDSVFYPCYETLSNILCAIPRDLLTRLE
jgi:hypothetical protein